MEYLVNGVKYNLSYQELKDYYTEICGYNRQTFKTNIPKILHVACIICYLKEIPTHDCLSDEGIIHQLVHILDNSYTEFDLTNIINNFKQQCKLS